MAVILKEEGLSFDDVLLCPEYSEVTPGMVDVSGTPCRGLTLKTPIISSAMDTVTESAMAIAMALEGGMGIIHKSMSIPQQAQEVSRVKAANVDLEAHPNAACDGRGHLLCGAALGITADVEERAQALIAAGVDCVVLDSAHGYSKNVLTCLRTLKANHPDLPVICGNVATYEGAKALIEAGADGVKVGMGPGSICSTRIISGMGVPQLTAIMECARATSEAKVPLIADGGIRYSGDVTKALAAGATCVMIGGLLAKTREAPGERVTIDGVEYKSYRGMGSLEAMSAAHGATDRYFQTGAKKLVAEGVDALVPTQGSAADTLFQLVGGLRSGMGYLGAHNLAELTAKARFIRISDGGLNESHPHDVRMTHAEPNYSGR